MTDFSAKIIHWYRENARALPWREDKAPYRVWLSEIMLQQTRIEAARDYFLRFTAALPDVFALAAADEEQVLKLWEGLGYYSRARNLHACAKKIVSEHNGVFPSTAAELKKLPGIGEYTAGAIASIAFGERVPAVDGNVLRVLSRFLALSECVQDERVKKALRSELIEILPAETPGDFNAGIMELGETVCTPGTPDCARCPLKDECRAHREERETDFPVLKKKKPRRVEERRVLLYLTDNKVAVRKRPAKGLLAGLWEFPNDGETAVPEGGEFCGEAVHVFSHVEWRMKGYILRAVSEEKGLTYVTAAERAALAMPSAFRYYSALLTKLGY